MDEYDHCNNCHWIPCGCHITDLTNEIEELRRYTVVLGGKIQMLEEEIKKRENEDKAKK